jgi:hypothetical protein
MAEVLIGFGAALALLGLMAVTLFGFSLLVEPKDGAGWGDIDSASFEPPPLPRLLRFLFPEDPDPASQTDEKLPSLEETRRSQPETPPDLKQLVRVMYVSRYGGIAMVLVGVGLVVAGMRLGLS